MGSSRHPGQIRRRPAGRALRRPAGSSAQLSAALFTLLAVVGMSFAASAGASIRGGEVRLAAPSGAQSALLVPVAYRLEHTGSSARGSIGVRAANGRTVRRSWSDRIHSGSLRAPDRRRSFRFVHAVPIGPALARILQRGSRQVRIASRVVVDHPEGFTDRVRRTAFGQRGLRRAPLHACSTAPMIAVAAGSGLTRAQAPYCGGPTRWSVQTQPSLARVAIRGNALTARIGPRRSGPDRAVLIGRLGGGAVARQALQFRIGPPGSAQPPSVVAMGDSVTAGFGYYGATGREMPITQLLNCRPGDTVYNDACSSNSSNTSNAGTALNFLLDYGLSRNISWAAQWANRYGVTDYRNYAVSGSAPVDWLPGGQFASLLDEIKGLDPDYIVMTMGANPLLSDMLFGLDNMGCAVEADLFGDYRECVERAFASVDLSGRLNDLYTELVEGTQARIVLMHYHLSIPSSALAYSAEQIEMMGRLLNQVVSAEAAAVSTDRITVVSPPRFFVGIDMEPLYPSRFSCSWLDYEVDGPSVQSTPTQDELYALHPLSFCSGPVTGPPWVISGDTGIHPSATGYSRMASRLPAPE